MKSEYKGGEVTEERAQKRECFTRKSGVRGRRGEEREAEGECTMLLFDCLQLFYELVSPSFKSVDASFKVFLYFPSYKLKILSTKY
jgi:hypothetical protein